MRLEVRICKRINFGIQCEISGTEGSVCIDYFADAKKRTLYVQSSTSQAFEALLIEQRDALRDALDAARSTWVNKKFVIDLTGPQAELPGMQSPVKSVEGKNDSLQAQAQTGEEWELFTDGGASPNPGQGACAWIIRQPDGSEQEGARYAPATTNNRMELLGVIEGLTRIPRTARVTVRSDSKYVQQGITSWIKGWKKKGWKTAKGTDVLNRDLWEQLDAVSAGRELRWLWVRGHAGHAENERCDALVGQARRSRSHIGI
jgi:ribonuclease HI